jgi:hypothetical protein
VRFSFVFSAFVASLIAIVASVCLFAGIGDTIDRGANWPDALLVAVGGGLLASLCPLVAVIRRNRPGGRRVAPLFPGEVARLGALVGSIAAGVALGYTSTVVLVVPAVIGAQVVDVHRRAQKR